MEILNQFGFDPRLFIAQIINFLVLIFIFRKFLYGPLLKMMRAREEKIRKGVNDAELAQVALAEAEKKQDEIIKKAGIEAEKILAQSKKTAADIRDETLTKTREEADKIIKNAKEQGALELEKVKKEAEGIALSISKTILSQALEGLFNDAEKKTILNRNVEKLKKYESTRS